MTRLVGAWWGAVLVFVFVLGLVGGVVLGDAISSIGRSSADTVRAVSCVVEEVTG